jgi:cyclase
MLGKGRSLRLGLTFVLFLARDVSAHPQNEPRPITVTYVQGNVYVIDGAIDEIGVSVGKDGILLVDGGYMETFPGVRKAIKGLGKGTPKFLINTHWHHAFANEAFGSSTVLISHHLARERLQHENTMYTYKVAAQPSIAWPVITFDETLTIHFNGEEISLIYLPQAHTDGDIAVIFHQSNVVLTGDVFVPSIPGIDTASGGTVAGLQAGIDKLLQIVPKDARIIPGHGRVSTYPDLLAFRQLVADSVQFVKSELSAGKTLAEIEAAGVPDKWKKWEKEVPQEMFVESIYKQLIGENSFRTE